VVSTPDRLSHFAYLLFRLHRSKNCDAFILRLSASFWFSSHLVFRLRMFQEAERIRDPLEAVTFVVIDGRRSLHLNRCPLQQGSLLRLCAFTLPSVLNDSTCCLAACSEAAVLHTSHEVSANISTKLWPSPVNGALESTSAESRIADGNLLFSIIESRDKPAPLNL
jgi:hypothetical protein